MTKTTKIGATAVLAAAVVLLAAWGDAGHRMTGKAAALSMPGSMPAFFRNASEQLSYLNPEPDRWKDRAERDVDPAWYGSTDPDHFVDYDLAPAAVADAALQAPTRYAYMDSLRKSGIDPVKYGFLPFAILERAQQLRVDFRIWRMSADSVKPFVEARIINDAGILGHFVADGSNPLHASDQFNGWTRANPNGYATDKQTHARFESGFVGAQIKLDDIMAKMDTNARVLPDFRAAIIAYIKESNSQVEPLYRLDRMSRFDTNTTAGVNKAFATDRLVVGAKMLRDIWWTAWITSVQPIGRGRSGG
jgi:hypothetical protein